MYMYIYIYIIFFYFTEANFGHYDCISTMKIKEAEVFCVGGALFGTLTEPT